MTDKIDNNFTTRLAQAERKRVAATPAEAKSAGTGSAAKANDQVRLTDTAQRLLGLETEVRAAPEIREARVAELKRRIDAGEYAIDAARIADRLLESEAALLSLGARITDRNVR